MRAPEITKNSQFGNIIMNVITTFRIKSVIEIGSGSGNGSTQCFIEALLRNGDRIKLYCFEPQAGWYVDLVNNTKQYDWIKCFNNSAISFDDFLIKDFNKDFLENKFARGEAESWYLQDLPFFQKEKVSILPSIEAECALIDGSAFSGYSEYKKLHPSVKWIMLDDIFYFKCNEVYDELKNNQYVTLIAEGNERNGWAIFKR